MFACHSDGSQPAGQGNDYYAIARSTLGTANPVTLRFDLLKVATNQVLNLMAATNTTTNSLSVGIFTFNSVLTQVYPASGEAGSDFSAAIAAVGLPPNGPNQPDTGIQPEVLIGNAAHANTDFTDTMNSLAQVVTASGNGSSLAKAHKVLFIVTDGMEDANDHADYGAFDTTRCDVFKNMGYQIYVIYTPFYPLMWQYWYDGMGGPVTNNQIVPALRSCSSGPAYFISASDGPSLNAAMQSFLLSALNAPSRLVK